jgi:hypothetical protein
MFFVARISALMALCDQLEARLKERAGMQGRLANAIVKTISCGAIQETVGDQV